MSIRSSFKILAAAAVVAVLAQSGAAQAASLVADGTFIEGAAAGSFSTIAGGASIGPWLVTGDSVDLIGNYWAQAPGGSYTVDLDGGGIGGLSQSLSLAAGSYELSFYLSGNPDGGPAAKGVSVSVGGVTAPFSFTTTGDTHASMGYLLETVDFTLATAGTTLLSFTSTTAGSYGAVIGDVSLVSVVPEPTSMALMLAGLGLVGTVMRRRNRSI